MAAEGSPPEIDESLWNDAPLGEGENAVGAAPPGVEWNTHGGYLGCLIGCLASFLIGGFLGSVLLGTLYVVGGGAALVLAAVSVVIYTGIVYGLCRLGWWLGKRYYRSYQTTGSTTWGEHDEFEYGESPAGSVAESPDAGDESVEERLAPTTPSAQEAGDLRDDTQPERSGEGART